MAPPAPILPAAHYPPRPPLPFLSTPLTPRLCGLLAATLAGHAIDLDRDFNVCSSTACTTFGSPALTSEGVSFPCKVVEVWSLETHY